MENRASSLMQIRGEMPDFRVERSKTYSKQRKLTAEELGTILAAHPQQRDSLEKQLANRYFLISAIPDILALAQTVPSVEPRKLTQEEIQQILTAMPKVRSADARVSQEATNQINDKLRAILTNVVITPLGIPELIQSLVSSFEHSRIVPGSTVGVTTGESFGAQITQMTLNTFHSSGAAKNVSAGVTRIRELLRASPEPKLRSCSIFFRKKLALEQVLTTKRAELVDLSIQDIIKNYHIDSKSSLMDTEPRWYQTFRRLVRGDFPHDGFLLRLELDVGLLYAHKVRMVDVATTIESGDNVVAVYSPLNLGLIDIYASPDVIMAAMDTVGFDVNQATISFLQTIVLPKIGPLRIKGVPGIRGLYPVTLPVMSIVKSEEKLGDNLWLLKFHQSRMLSSGITKRDLLRVAELSGLERVADPVYGDIGLVVRSGEGPVALINRTIDEADRAVDAGTASEQQQQLAKAAKFIYADTVGSNYRTLLSRDDINQRYTISNNMHEILETLGIEAARNFLFLELLRVVGAEGSYINPRHVGLLTEFMTNKGRILPISYYGIQRQPIGALALASFERSMEVFKTAGAYGKIEDISSTSTSIYIGKRAPIGTGYIDVLTDRDMIEQRQQELQARSDPQTMSDAIWELDNISLGNPLVDQNSNPEDMFTAATPPMVRKETYRAGTTLLPMGSLSSPPPSTSVPMPVVSNQLVEVDQTVKETGIPCLPPVSEAVSEVSISSERTLPVNRNLRAIPSPSRLLGKAPQVTSPSSARGTITPSPNRVGVRRTITPSRSVIPKRK